jgi:hypothetical protein
VATGGIEPSSSVSPAGRAFTLAAHYCGKTDTSGHSGHESMLR